METNSLLGQLAVPEPRDLDVLGGLGAQVGVRGLDRLEDAGDLARGGVDLSDREDGLAAESDDRLVVLLLELVGVRTSGEGDGVVVTGRATPALGVEEGRATVGRDGEVTAERGEGALGGELLDGEQERDALSSGELDGDGGVVDAVLLLELDCIFVCWGGGGGGGVLFLRKREVEKRKKLLSRVRARNLPSSRPSFSPSISSAPVAPQKEANSERAHDSPQRKITPRV